MPRGARVEVPLFAEMSDAEKLRLIEGDVDFWEGRLRTLQEGSNTHPPQAARCSRLGIPGIAFVDGPRGSAIPPANCFPGRGRREDEPEQVRC